MTATADQDLETLAMEHPVLKQALTALDQLSADPEARIRAEQREMALISYELELTKARREGQKEGRAEGRAEALANLLQRQLTIKFGELPASITQRLLAATEADVLRWSERVLSADTLDGVFG